MTRSQRVSGLVNALTKPLFVYRMSMAQAHRQDAKGQAARTSLAKAEEELIQVVLSYLAPDATKIAAAIEDRLNTLYPEDDHEFKAREAADVVVALLPSRHESDAKLERIRFWLDWWRSSKSTTSAEEILNDIIGVVDPTHSKEN